MLTAGIVSSYAAAAASIGNVVASPILQNKINNKQFDQNKALMSYQNELQMQTWETQQNAINEYNKPVNQIARLSEAGINPNSIGDVQGNYSSVSPEASIGLGSTNPQSVMPDLSVFSDLAKNFFEGQDVELRRKQTDLNEKLVDSSIKVQSQQVENLLLEKDKTKASIDEIKTRTAAIVKDVDIKYQQLKQGLFDLKFKALRFGLDSYRNNWEEAVARMGASTDRMNAVTNRQNYKLAKQSLLVEANKFDNQFEFEVKKWESEFKLSSMDKIYSMYKDRAGNVNLGFLKGNIFLPKDLLRTMSFVEAFHNSAYSLPDFKISKLAPLVDDCMDSLNMVESYAKKSESVSGNSRSKKFVPNYSPYLPKNVSDGF